MKKVITLLLWSSICADPAIIMFLNSPPPKVIKSVKSKLGFIESKIHKFARKSPSQSSAKIMRSHLLDTNMMEGFLALYSKGYSTYSDSRGLISFPLRHTPVDVMHIVITPDVKLTRIASNTFSGVELNAPAKMFKYQIMRNQSYFWRVTEVEATSDIPDEAITIITKPKNIYVQTGDFLVHKLGPNLTLPNNVYVVGKDNHIETLLRSFDRARFFDPTKFNQNGSRSVIIN